MQHSHLCLIFLSHNIRSWGCGLLIVFFCVIQGDFVSACVDRKLQIGYKRFTEQAILAQMLAILIRERLGSSVTLKSFKSNKAAYRAIAAGNIQIFIEYTGFGLGDILGGVPKGSDREIYQTVKKAYKDVYNLIWLRPFGFQTTYKYYRKYIKAGIPLEAVPIVKKETLDDFPALARLINQISGKIDNNTISDLIAQVDENGERPEDIAGLFLKKLNISFSFIPGKG